MWNVALILVCIGCAAFAGVVYVRSAGILSGIEKMIDDVLDHTFSEEHFTEGRLSRLESRMYRYLSAEKLSLAQTHTERDSIKTLISDISHQMKTPVSNILLYTQLLKEVPELSGSTEKIVEQIEGQTEKLRFLLDALIKTSRLENGIIQIAPKKNSVRALLEALSNIVDNAIKYTPATGTVTLRVKVYEMFACIDVADDGIGISEEESAKIFTRFYRSPRVYDEKGVGIGLYVAREIVRQEGGYIRVRSRTCGGAVFSVFLPR